MRLNASLRAPAVVAALSAGLLMTALAGCARDASVGGRGFDVRRQFDRNVDFSKYDTYRFVGGQVVERPGTDPEDRRRADDAIRAAVDRAMTARGYESVTDSPKLLVSYTAGAQRKTDLQRLPPAAGAPGVGRTAWDTPGAWRPAGWAGAVDDAWWGREYLAGTVILDLYDAATNTLVYRAYCEGEVIPGLPADQLQQRADRLIEAALRDLPPAARR